MEKLSIGAPRVSFTPCLRELWKEAFGDTDGFLDNFERCSYSHNRCRVAMVGDEVVGALYWFDSEYCGGRIAYIYAVATAKSHRGRGICTALLEDTHRHLTRLGYVGVLLVPAKPSLYSFYERLGYRVCSEISEFRRECAQESIELTQTDAFEYSRLRKDFLPSGAVLQESVETLALLESETRFYFGSRVIFAAREQMNDGEKELFCLEILGDISASSGILAALGYKTGVFRTAGDGRAFAMYFPLREAPVPSYFAFALD